MTSTAPEDVDLRRVRLYRDLRRVFVALLVAFLVLAMFGFFGVRSRTVSARGGGFRLQLTYAATSRPGVSTPWALEVRHPGGFDDPVTVATSSRYLDILEVSNMDPEPSKTSTTGDLVVWEFDPPSGDTLDITLDANVDPSVQWGRKGATSVLVDGKPAATVRYRTWVLP